LKRMVFGTILFSGGLIGVVALLVVAAFNPWDYNGITGLRGSLLGTGTMPAFVFFCALVLIGTVICVYEAYIKE